jgi:hypothetical protein
MWQVANNTTRGPRPLIIENTRIKPDYSDLLLCALRPAAKERYQCWLRQEVAHSTDGSARHFKSRGTILESVLQKLRTSPNRIH